MNKRLPHNDAFIESTCDKYLNRLKSKEKQSSKMKHGSTPQQQQQQLPQRKSATKSSNYLMNEHSPPVKDKQERNKGSSCKSLSDEFERVPTKTTRHEQQTWKHLLLGNKINYIDPLRTLDSLLRELKFKLDTTHSGDVEIHEMITDIQHVLKRIPSDIITVMNLPTNNETPRGMLKKMLEKSCQTAPNLTQDDTDKLRRIMEENTLKLESSCRQLESLCANLQNENVQIEKQLKNERDNVKSLEKKIKILEKELLNISRGKLKELEDENEQLRYEILQLSSKNYADKTNSSNLKQIINDLEKQKSLNDQQRSQLNYELTLTNMEKEKYLAMLTIRDREIKGLREEMMKLQDHFSQNFTNLNKELVSLVPSFKNVSQSKDSLGVGDSISSITTDYSVNKDVGKKSPVQSKMEGK